MSDELSRARQALTAIRALHHADGRVWCVTCAASMPCPTFVLAVLDNEDTTT